MGGENLLFTADFCGVACEVVRRETDGAVMPFFLQGCAGNINPNPRGMYEDVTRHGETLGLAAVDALQNAVPFPSHDLDFAEATVDLPLLPPPSVEACEQSIAHWEEQVEIEKRGGHRGRILHAEGMRDYAQYERRMTEQPADALSIPFTLQRITIGEAQLLGMPAEMFVQYAVDFDRQTPGPLFALAYTNGVHGYVPTAADYPLGGYEVEGAHRYYGTLMFTPDCERLIRAAAYNLLGVQAPDWTPYAV
jgi:hypothetical protein